MLPLVVMSLLLPGKEHMRHVQEMASPHGPARGSVLRLSTSSGCILGAGGWDGGWGVVSWVRQNFHVPSRESLVYSIPRRVDRGWYRSLRPGSVVIPRRKDFPF
jgi:hypothetical protein